MKRRIISIILYLLPIILVTAYTKEVSAFCVSTGVMTILLGICLKFFPEFTGIDPEKEIHKNSYLFAIICGIVVILIGVL